MLGERVVAVLFVAVVLLIAYAATHLECDGTWVSGMCIKRECVR